MRGEDASDRGTATGNNQLARQKDESAAQHERQPNNSNATVAAMVTATAAATTATMVAAAAMKTMAGRQQYSQGSEHSSLRGAADKTGSKYPHFCKSLCKAGLDGFQ
jgi:hypothetical protein